jgi:glycosyltransferase involved in cell wall biosynthesis
LASDKGDDLSHWVWQRKRASWKNLQITLVAPSRWMASAVKASPLFPQASVELIPHGVDTRVYRPRDKQQARAELRLPQDKLLILFGAASDGRHKGLDLLNEALTDLNFSRKNDIELMLFGPGPAKKIKPIPLPVHAFGHIGSEEKLAQLYSAADLSVVPSLQESFGLVALESLACATPVVSFATTGLLDLVKHRHNGYLAQPFEASDLARGIRWTLAGQDRRQQLGMNARELVEREFSLTLQAERYLSLYRDLRQ